MKISIQGYLGSYHDLVARKKFGQKSETLERDTFKEVFADVADGRAEYGVIAIENSIAGSIMDNFDLLLKNNLFIIGELYLRIAHQLMALPGTSLDEVQEVLSHPMALKQCESFLEKHPQWKILEEPDTAGSAAKIRDKHLVHSAAIASKLAAEIYDLDILAKDIETDKKNYTRFLIISPKEEYPENSNKTSIVFTAADVPGSLTKILTILADYKINLTKVESRPVVGKAWSYYFYVDFEAGVQEERTKQALEEIEAYTDSLRILGSYEKGAIED